LGLRFVQTFFSSLRDNGYLSPSLFIRTRKTINAASGGVALFLIVE
jgi:hypothetical protein